MFQTDRGIKEYAGKEGGMKDCRIVMEIKDDKVNIEREYGGIAELVFVSGALQQIIGLDAVKHGVSLDDVKDNMLELHLKAMQGLTDQIIRERGDAP